MTKLFGLMCMLVLLSGCTIKSGTDKCMDLGNTFCGTGNMKSMEFTEDNDCAVVCN